MKSKDDYSIDEETIKALGLRPVDKPDNITLAPDARVFEYPHLENVFIMESDLYGNKMPKGSCFLAFHGRTGLIGRHLSVDNLKNCSVEEIRQLVQSNSEG